MQSKWKMGETSILCYIVICTVHRVNDKVIWRLFGFAFGTAMPEDKPDETRTTVNFHFNDLWSWVEARFDVEQHSFLIGLNSAVVGAISTFSYPSLANVGPKILLPTLCGVTGSNLWRRYLSEPLKSGEFDCPVCTTTRGMTIAFVSAAVIPAIAGGVLLSRTRKTNHVRHIAKDFIWPYTNDRKKPYLGLAIVGHVSLGFIMADREFENRIRQIVASSELQKGRRVDEQVESAEHDDM